MKQTILFLFYLIALIGCSGNSDDNKECITIAFEDINSLEVKKITKRFIPLETREDNLIGEVTKVDILENRVFVMDGRISKSLQVYDLNGKFIQKIGNLGGGRGEYASIWNFTFNIEKQTITLEDRVKNILNIYDLNTYEYITSLKIPFNYVMWQQLEDGNFVFYNSLGYKKAKEHYYIRITDSLFNNIGYHAEADFIANGGFYVGEMVYKFNNKHFWHFPTKPILYEITTEKITPVYHFSFGSQLLPPLEYLLQESAGDRSYGLALASSDYMVGYSINETDNFIAAFYTVKRQPYICFYDKRKKQTLKLTYQEFTKLAELDGFMTPFFAGNGNKYFYTSLSAEGLLEYNTQDENIKAIQKRISLDDNPIICMFTLDEE